jgi:DNA segregation ATPase FtsK/SpoIIIE, S-DNA-T family
MCPQVAVLIFCVILFCFFCAYFYSYSAFLCGTIEAMAVKKKPTKRTKKIDEVEVVTPSFLDSMSPETVRGIIGVFLFVLAIIILLSALGLAGIAGEKTYAGIFYIVGIGYWLLPFMLSAWAWSFFTKAEYNQSALHSIRGVGGVTFFLSLLGIIAVIASPHAAGKLGVLLASPLQHYLDTIATLVILAGVLIISLLLLFDSELWILLGSKIARLFKRTPHTLGEDKADDTSYVSSEHIDDSPQAEKVISKAELESEENIDDEEEYILPAPEEAPKLAPKKKKEAIFQMPTEYTPPPLTLLQGDRGKVNVGDTKIRANIIRKTLQHFKIPVEMDEVVVGPSVTRYSLKPAAGVRLSKIVALQSNLELALAASPIRIEAPIPGKSLVGIEVPNAGKSFVGLSGLFESPEFAEETLPLFIALGKDIAGSAHYGNIGKMPHLLVAGTTGSGKSVMIHSIITSLLYRNGPERLRFIMVDPKRVELTLYNDIPHLLTPVITDAKKCILSLKWAAKEMERRYDILQEHKMQDIAGYHTGVVAPAHEAYEKAKEKGKDVSTMEMPEQMPHIVIIIDELADIMTNYPRELEGAIVRLAQMSRAVGIHLILSTQRPSAQVITGLIKANIPSRIALKVSSLLESRIILDQSGAEKLLGAGDMLYLSADMAKPRRIQSPFLTTEEVRRVVEHLIKNNSYELDAVVDFTDNDGNGASAGIPFDRIEEDDDLDELYEDVREFIMKEKKASTSFIQRRFKVGYGRAARIMDQLEERGVISSSDGTNKPREVLGFGDSGSSFDDERSDSKEDRRTEYE